MFSQKHPADPKHLSLSFATTNADARLSGIQWHTLDSEVQCLDIMHVCSITRIQFLSSPAEYPTRVRLKVRVPEDDLRIFVMVQTVDYSRCCNSLCGQSHLCLRVQGPSIVLPKQANQADLRVRSSQSRMNTLTPKYLQLHYILFTCFNRADRQEIARQSLFTKNSPMSL